MSSLGADTRLLWFSVICCLTKGVLPEEPYVYSISECRYQYSSINTGRFVAAMHTAVAAMRALHAAQIYKQDFVPDIYTSIIVSYAQWL